MHIFIHFTFLFLIHKKINKKTCFLFLKSSEYQNIFIVS